MRNEFRYSNQTGKTNTGAQDRTAYCPNCQMHLQKIKVLEDKMVKMNSHKFYRPINDHDHDKYIDNLENQLSNAKHEIDKQNQVIDGWAYKFDVVI